MRWARHASCVAIPLLFRCSDQALGFFSIDPSLARETRPRAAYIPPEVLAKSYDVDARPR
jgi:hypothetical protein